MTNVVKISLIISIVSIFSAQDDLEFSGYFKTLPSTSRFAALPSVFGFNSEAYYAGISSQLRFNARYYANEDLTINIELKNLFLTGDLYKYQRILNAVQDQSTDYIDLTHTFVSNEQTLIESRLDRLWMQYSTGDLLVTAGRQRIAWGTAFAWNPTDLFNPVSPLDFDNEEKDGADAIRAQYYFGAASKVDLVYKTANKKKDRVYSALIGFNSYDYDLNLIVASYRENLLLGFSWAGDIEGAGFRGEITYHDDDDIFVVDMGNLRLEDGQFYSMSLSFDYTFASSLYIQSEALYNGNRLGLTGSEWSLLFGLAYQFTPLLTGNLTFIYNPIDFSEAILPSLSYSVITNLDLSFFSLISFGDLFDEYPESYSYYLRLKWSF